MPNIFGLPTQQEIAQERHRAAVELYSRAAPGVAPAVVAGQGLGRAMGGLLGIPDAQMERTKRLRQIQEEMAQDGVLAGQEGFIDEARRRARARGLFDVDAMLAERGQEMEKKALEVEKLRLGNQRQRQQIAAENEIIAAKGQLTGPDRILSELAGLEGSTAAAENARALAVAAMERAGVQESQMNLANVARAGRAVQAALAAQQRQTVTQQGISGSVSTTTPDLSAQIADKVVARAIGAGALRQGGAQPAPVSGLATSSPLVRDRAQSVSANSKGLVKAKGTGEPIEYLTIDKAAQVARNGKIVLEDVVGPDAYTSEGASPEVIKQRQIAADHQLSAIGKVVGLNNAVAEIIATEGQAFPSALGRWAAKMKEVTQGSNSWTADLIRTASVTMRQFANDIKDPQEQLIVKKLNQAVQRNALTQKEIESLGALSGPDFQILRAITDNPTEYLFRRTGIRGYFDLASESVNQMYLNAQNVMSGTGLRGINAKSLPAPHEFIRLGRHRAEVEDISQQMAQGMTPDEGARAMSQRLGFKVSPKGAQMISNTGMYTPAGSDSENIKPGPGTMQQLLETKGVDRGLARPQPQAVPRVRQRGFLDDVRELGRRMIQSEIR